MRLTSVSWFRATTSLILTAFAGCSSSAPVVSDPVSQPYHGQEVKLFAPASLNLPATWEILIQEWSSQSGASAQFVEYDASAPEIENSIPASDSGGTLILFPVNRLCDLQDRIQSLAVQEADFDAKDIFKGLRERVFTREQKLVANPISVPILSCYYRSDLLRDANLSAPETWEEYDNLVASMDQWATGLIAVEPLSPEFRASTFFARSLAHCKHPENYSVWFDLESGKPILNNPGFERAIEISAQTWKRLGPNSKSLNPADCRKLILEGKAAITLAFEPADVNPSSRSTEQSLPQIDRKEGIEIGISRIPGSRTVYNRNSKKWDSVQGKAVHAPVLCGFAGLASAILVESASRQGSAAMNLLATLSSADVFHRAFSTLPKSLCRESQTISAPSWYGPELTAEESSRYCDVVAQSLRDSQVVFELPLLGAVEFRRAVTDSLERLFGGDVDHKQALESMQKSMEEIVERLGAEQVRNSYRKGLGLSPIKPKN